MPVQLPAASMGQCDDADMIVKLGKQERKGEAAQACSANGRVEVRSPKCGKTPGELRNLTSDPGDLGK